MQKVRKHKRLRNTYKRIFALVLAVTLAMFTPIMAFADIDSDSETIKALVNFKDLIIAVVKIVGVIITLLGIFQVGTSIPAHDPSQRAMGFLVLAGGVLVFFADNILETIGIM